MLPSPSPKSELPPLSADGLPSTDAMLDRATTHGHEALQRFSHEAEDFATRSAAQIRRRAAAMQALTVDEVQSHPLRALLLAAAGGVALTLLVRLLLRR